MMAESYSIQNLENKLAAINLDDMDSIAEAKLAAEIGQLLLQRNQALEASLERNQQIIADQQAEIDKLVKQSQYLQETNMCSQKISEQLEMNLLELERSNEMLLKQKSTDQDILRDLRERKDFLERRCGDLEESYEFIEEKLVKVQTKHTTCDHQTFVSIDLRDSVNEDEEPQAMLVINTPANIEEELAKKLEYITADLTDTKCEVAIYQQRMQMLEAKLARVLDKNLELEDALTSKKFKSRTTTSGCSSGLHKNTASLAEEIEAAKLSQSLGSFAEGCFVTSTPPKVPERSPTTVIDITSEDIKTCDKSTVKKSKKQRKSKRSAFLKKKLNDFSHEEEQPRTEHRVRINVCIEIEPNERHLLCRQPRLRCVASTVILSYKDTVISGLHKMLAPFFNPPRNYLGALLLWSNKNFIERNIRIM